MDEPTETFTVTLSSPSGATVADDEGIGTITDNDGVRPSLSIDDVTVTEAVGGVDAVFTVTLSNPASTAVTVSYATSNGSGTGAATAGSDYTAIECDDADHRGKHGRPRRRSRSGSWMTWWTSRARRSR